MPTSESPLTNTSEPPGPQTLGFLRASSLPRLETTTRALLDVAVILALVVVFFICMRPVAITDFWWQAKTGELILQNGAIPRTDPFSWTAAGQPWLIHEWLTEVVLYLILTHLPDWTLLVWKSGLAALACGLVLARSWMRSGSLVLGIGAAVAAGFVLRNYTDVRPQMVTFVLLAGILLALDVYREGGLRRLPWILPGVFALWANLHGAVVVGLLLIALWVVGDALEHWVYRERSPGLAALALGVAASGIALGLNPNGFHLYTYPFVVLGGHSRVMDYIVEWQSPDFHSAVWRPFEYLLLGTLGILALARSGVRRVRWGDVLVLLAMAHAALLSRRNTAPFALVAAPLLASALGGLWREAEPLRLIREAGRLPAARATGAIVLCAALVMLLYVELPRDTPLGWDPAQLVHPDEWFEYAVKMNTFPQDAVRQMKERNLWPGPMYNDYDWGGYLIWSLYPQRKVFIDGRTEIYYGRRPGENESPFDDEITIHMARPKWQEALDRRGVRVVLTRHQGALFRALAASPRWELVFAGMVEAVFTRRD